MFPTPVFRRVAGWRGLLALAVLAGLLLVHAPTLEHAPREHVAFWPVQLHPVLFCGPLVMLPLAWDGARRD
jgi:hypothetical protein